jgi:glycosyltransferase involved in cell wall biosynthesis
MTVEKVFQHEIWHSDFPFTGFRFGRKISSLIENIRFYRILRSVLKKEVVNSDWVVFCDMVVQNQLLAWAWWFRGLAPDNLPRLILLFRYGSEGFDYWSDHKTTSYAFSLLERAGASDRVRICSDSERLAKEYSRFTDLQIKVVPIPHTIHAGNNVSTADRSSQRDTVCLVSLGGARDEKGFLEIIEAIKILHRSGELKKFSFVLQANMASREISSSIEEIRTLNLDNVDFIDEDLVTEKYYTLLQKADAILLPYWRGIYASRTSGIFTEALAAGKPVIATDDTWMSDQLKRYGSGLLCRDRDPKDLARAMMELEANFDDYANKALLCRRPWLEKHNPDMLFESLVTP